MSVYRTTVRRGIVGVKPPPWAVPYDRHSTGSQPKNAMRPECTNKYRCHHSSFQLPIDEATRVYNIAAKFMMKNQEITLNCLLEP